MNKRIYAYTVLVSLALFALISSSIRVLGASSFTATSGQKAPEGTSGTASPTSPSDFAQPQHLDSYGGTDVNTITGSQAWPKVTQYESAVWGEGSTVVAHYIDSYDTPNCFNGISYSTNNGVTWTRILPSPICSGHGRATGDAMIVYNKALAKWFALSIAEGCSVGHSPYQGLGLWESSNGILWSTGACAHGDKLTSSRDDRPSMWVDNNCASPCYGRMYISFKDFTFPNNQEPIRTIYSDNGTTWSAPVTISDPTIHTWNVQITGSPSIDGTVFVAGMISDYENTPHTNVIYRSTDGGDSWTTINVGTAFYPGGDYFYCNGNKTWGFPPVWFSLNWGQPGVGPDGVVHLVYVGLGVNAGDLGDIFYTRSVDNGLHWAPPIVLNTDRYSGGTHSQWMPSLAVTYQGAVLVSWYDQRNSSNGSTYEYWGRASTDNGVTWLSDMQISDVAIQQPSQPDPKIRCMAGDYGYSSAQGTTIYDVWVDGRTPIPNATVTPGYQQDTFFDKVTLTTTLCLTQFKDVPVTNTFYPYVHCLACQNVISGYPCNGEDEPCDCDNTPYFRPGNDITRGAACKVVSIAAGFNEPVSGQAFEDVAPGSTYYEYVERMASRGIVAGYPCGNPEPCIPPNNRPYFRPNNSVSRGQLSKIVSEAKGYNDVPVGQLFEDVQPASTFYTYAQRLASRGIMSGYPCGNPEPCVPPNNRPYFRPGDNSSRGQTSKIVTLTFYPACAPPQYPGNNPGEGSVGAPNTASATPQTTQPPISTSTPTTPTPVYTVGVPTPWPTIPAPVPTGPLPSPTGAIP